MRQLSPRRFSPVQDARSETLSQALSSLTRPRAEQSSSDFEFIFAAPEGAVDKAALVTDPFQGPSHSTQTRISDDAQAADVLYPVPPVAAPRELFKVLQKWEGTVQEIDGGSFIAILRDLTTPENGEEQVTLRFEEVSDDDRTLVAPGALFYWAMGYKTTFSGARERVSGIRFRRIPPLSQRELSRSRREAKRLLDFFA